VSSILLPLISFAIAATGTPGPNNIMLTASGANFGYRRSLPHIFGILFGFPSMVLAVGLGLGQVFTVYPQLHEILKWVGSAYLLFLAWKIATAARPKSAAHEAKPLTFLQAALFQWVNPKAWIMTVAALTAYTTGEGSYVVETFIVAGVFFAVSFPLISMWCLFGALIGRWLTSQRALMIFNGTMSALIVASIALLYI